MLLNCPFCNSKAEVIDNAYIICTGCPANMGDELFLNELIKAWNTRIKHINQ